MVYNNLRRVKHMLKLLKPTKYKILLSFLTLILLSFFPIIPNRWQVEYYPVGLETGFQFVPLIEFPFALISYIFGRNGDFRFAATNSINIFLFSISSIFLFLLIYLIVSIIPNVKRLIIGLILVGLIFFLYNQLMFHRSNLKNIPETLDASKEFLVQMELYPKNKKYDVHLELQNLSKSSDVEVLDNQFNISNNYSKKIDFSATPASTDNKYKLIAYVSPSSSSLLNSFGQLYSYLLGKVESNSFSIEVTSQDFNVDIFKNLKRQRNNNDADTFLWFPFTNLDVYSGLEKLCLEKGRCFELAWSGDRVKFYNGYTWAAKQYGTNNIITKKSLLYCEFHGKGTQRINLEIRENGKIVGSGLYEYEVLNGVDDEFSLCGTNE